MVWRESSWAAHYQSPLPASDTLFTEVPRGLIPLGEDSKLEGLPSHPPPPAPALEVGGWAKLTAGSILAFLAHTNVAPRKAPAHPHLCFSSPEIQPGGGGGDGAFYLLARPSPLGTLDPDREEGSLGAFPWSIPYC